MESKKNSNIVLDPSLSADENIELFLSKIEKEHPEFVAVLRDNLSKIYPLDDPSHRTKARTLFNENVRKFFDETVLLSNPQP